MRTARSIGGAIAALAACAAAVFASDRVGIYTRVDRVVLEPNAEAPKTIQVWGVFALAKPNDVNDYLPPARGYLYFTLPSDARAARAEWADLQEVAGTGQIVAFGSRFDLHPRVRRADERPADPDPYPLNVGLTKVRGRTDYAPIRSIAQFRE